MNLKVGIGTALSLALVLAVCGCGSGGTGKSASSCQPATSGVGTMTWLDDGIEECATSASATFSNNPQYTIFQATNTPPTFGIFFSVSTVLGPGPIGGSYSCVPLDSLSVTFSYTQGQSNVAAQSCELTLNPQGTPGVHATGTFSATLSGGTGSITNGVFDLPVTIYGGN
jgi:hypothetical protein